VSGVDHRPYLVEGDLRTPEDVLAWLCEYDPREQLGDALVELRVQLRRERRQACRRGARIAWRAAAKAVRAARECTTGDLWWATYAIISSNVYRALAFRAAARQP
jgi:hypothetical protein